MPTTSPSHQSGLKSLVATASTISTVPYITRMKPSTDASAQNASFGFAYPQMAPSTKMTPRNPWTTFQPPGVTAIAMNSVIAATVNTTPISTPIVDTDDSVNRSTTREIINQMTPVTMNTHQYRVTERV